MVGPGSVFRLLPGWRPPSPAHGRTLSSAAALPPLQPSQLEPHSAPNPMAARIKPFFPRSRGMSRYRVPSLGRGDLWRASGG